ncbi:C6 zinc finger domain [Pyrenophora seminiperda CCB06]|uniref:C6 zinc finger domain n=1 Tax=Pyrenophora seminiperda CCB06 TaxID=1302712 RepID=A0A3M7LXY9_9PLEO|nr:C6 zinc finger domain [Pyrenophora seminiperda CCB06]
MDKATASGKPRQRAWKPKARSGCKTCKIRKVKCDEEKPHCNRCTSTGRTCDGYDLTFRPPPPSTPSPPAPRRDSHHSGASWGIVRSHSPVFLAPALRLNTREERESFDFFTSHAVGHLRGFLDSPFWQREVLQAAHRDSAIQHCIIALGAMYRRFFQGKNSHLTENAMSDKYLQFALRQSNRAIQDLLKKQIAGDYVKDRTSKVTLMTCSILFSSMCCLQGYQKQAIDHLRSGIRMLNEMDEEETKGIHPIDLESLRTIFVGLDMQVRAIMPSRESGSWVARPKTKPLSTSPKGVVLNMTTLITMLQHMESLMNKIHAFNQSSILRDPEEATDDVYTEYSDLLERYERGALVMQHLWSKAPDHGDEYTPSLTALELMQAQIEYLLRYPRADLVEKYPRLGTYEEAKAPFKQPFDVTAQFFHIFELATKLLPTSASPAPVFTTTMGPTSALWLVAIRAPGECQTLRRRAMNLMLNHPRREGFWDGMIAGRIAQLALSLEQERVRASLGLREDDESLGDLEVPDDIRIVAFFLTHPDDDDRKAKVEMSNRGDMAVGVPGAVRWLTW